MTVSFRHLRIRNPTSVATSMVVALTFENKPGTKPFREMLKEAFGLAEADSIVARLDSSIEAEWSETVEFRADLSYLPSK